MAEEGLKGSLVENDIVGSSAIAIKPVPGAVAFVETFSRSLRADFAPRLAWSMIGWSFGAADENMDEDYPARSSVGLSAAAVMDHIPQLN